VAARFRQQVVEESTDSHEQCRCIIIERTREEMLPKVTIQLVPKIGSAIGATEIEELHRTTMVTMRVTDQLSRIKADQLNGEECALHCDVALNQ
jgi:hypothetical protein